MSEIFKQYPKYIQDFIYKNRWNELNEIQKQAYYVLTRTDKDLIVASGTASGKTEAVFFPILTLLDKQPSNSVDVLYISPLKALINDQFSRLNGLLEDQNIKVTSWHGDISQSKKEKLINDPHGILQITPESLEAMFINNPGVIHRLFSDLKFIVVDEIHSFLDGDRGLQVQCLIERIKRASHSKPRIIGLSATISDPKTVEEYVNPDPNGIVTINQNKGRRLSLRVESYRISLDEEKRNKQLKPYYDFLYDFTLDKNAIIFTNSRNDSEEVIHELKQLAKKNNTPNIYHVHHGSISKELRLEAEKALKSAYESSVTAATVTLELGIDLGDLDFTVQIGSPFTCSSFVQRLGRSGRRTNNPAMLFINKFLPFEENVGSFPENELPWDLLLTIAILELYLKEKWIEPFRIKSKPFSLMVHQTLSTLANKVSLRPRDLAKEILTLPSFKNISQEEYKILLRHLLNKGYIEKIDDGTLALGLKAEAMVNNYNFYSVFKTKDTYKVVSAKKTIGELETQPQVDQVFLLAGSAWKVVSVDEERKTVYVIPFKGKRFTNFSGEGSDIDPRILEKVRQVLLSDETYAYLSDEAKALLEETRDKLVPRMALKYPLLESEDGTLYLFPWTGTKILRTLRFLFGTAFKDSLKIFDCYIKNFSLVIKSELDIDAFIEELERLHCFFQTILKEKGIKVEGAPKLEKFDYLVPDELLNEAYIEDRLDIEGALEVINQVVTTNEFDS